MIFFLLLCSSETVRVPLLTVIPKELPENGSRYSARVRSGLYSSLATKWWQAEQGSTSDKKGRDFQRGVGREGADGACGVINVSVSRCALVEIAVDCSTGSPYTTCRSEQGPDNIVSFAFLHRPTSF